MLKQLFTRRRWAGRHVVSCLLAALVTLVGTVFVAAPGPATAATTPAQTFPVSNSQLPLSPGCRFVDTSVPSSVLGNQIVSLPLGGSSSLTIHGRLCLPAGATPKTVMLALHGITYTNQYWDAGYQPDTYSFARAMMKQGYAVYAIDRLGYGKSAHPLGAAVTLDVQAAVVHQLIGELRAGNVGGTAFPYVTLVGHSYGTATAWLESAEYNDADAVIGTGWGSNIQNVPLIQFFAGFATHPSIFDAKTASEVPALDATYFTPPASARAESYLYDLSNVDPSILNYDSNVLRDTVTLGEGASFIDRYSNLSLGDLSLTGQEIKIPVPTSVTQQIKIPMFLVDGRSDLFFCGPNTAYCSSSQSLQKTEAAYFAPSACERAAVTDHAGHDLNLQKNAPFTYATITTFANQVLGPQGTNRASYRSTCQRFSGLNDTGGNPSFGPIATQ